MNNELDTYATLLIVALIIVQIRLHSSPATRAWIASRSRKVAVWTLNRADRFLHAFLMSPINPRRSSTKDTRD